MNKTYSGIGSRETPEKILNFMTPLSRNLDSLGYTLNSGGAVGADTAFSLGSNNKNIFIPWVGYNGIYEQNKLPQEAFTIAEKFHPALGSLTQGAKTLMARNVQIILGQNLDQPVDFVICWTQDGCIDEETRSKKTGGTGQAISIAAHHTIPVYNLQRMDHIHKVKAIAQCC